MTWVLALSKTMFHLIYVKLGSVATVWLFSQTFVCPCKIEADIAAWCALGVPSVPILLKECALSAAARWQLIGSCQTQL